MDRQNTIFSLRPCICWTYLNLGNKLALSEAVSVLPKVHCGAQLDGGRDCGINEGIQAVKFGDLDHLVDISLRCTVMPGCKPVQRNEHFSLQFVA